MRPSIKRNLILAICLFSLLVSIVSPVITVFADNDANAKFNEEVNEYIGDSEEFTDVVEKIQKDSEDNKTPEKNTIMYVMKRMFNAGEYINDVEYGVLDKDLGVSKKDILHNGRYACNPDAPNNLINHNCNIPNFTTGLLQNISATFTEPFTNAEKTSSYATFGLGVPRNIPGGKVPSEPGNRAKPYTALELFGYDLKLTSYSGEWDKIDVSSEARMLSNFGVIDKVTLMGTGLWNSVKAGVGGLIENFSFNPMRWIGNTIDTTISGGINTVIDTSDLNIVASNGWKRNDFNDTLYNVYVMSDKEVIQATANNYFKKFIDFLHKNAEVDSNLSAVLDLEQIPGFTFKPNWETEKSVKARKAAEAHNARERRLAGLDYQANYIPRYVDVPEPVYYTESEQLVFWGDDNKSIIKKAKSKGVLDKDVKEYSTYRDISDDWNENWSNYFSREFNAMGDTVNNLIEKSDSEVFKDNPHLDPKQPISHYACADENGNIKKDSDGNIEYLYLANNKGDKQFLNPDCAPARAPIGGALFGSGWHVDRPLDTRYTENISDTDFISARIQQFGRGFMSIFRSINSFIAKVTNTILGLAFSPIMTELGIDEIVGQVVEGFKKTIFFPLAALVATVGAFMMFLQLLKGQSASQILISVFITLLVFIAGAGFLMYPDSTIKLVDEVPTKVDNIIANAVMVDDDGTSYCSTGEEGDAIRSAQCNVWGIMVFNPWTNLQFGTGYENLYANGYAPEKGKELKNTNENLVGKAEVYMGGGQTINNWAMYQLDNTKSGTINSKDDSNNSGLGQIDKDLFRIVDLQAGPNNASGADTRYFKNWSGSDRSGGFVGFLTTIQSVLAAIAIGGLAIAKIEVSFIFSLSIIFLPIMLLYALMPQGRAKLKSYIAMLGNLLLKRLVITAMLSVLLKTISLSYSRLESITAASMFAIAISVAFIMYKKEILTMISADDGTSSQIKEMASESVPTFAKQQYRLTKERAKGMAAGALGGAAGGAVNSVGSEIRQRQISRRINKLDMKATLTEEESNERNELIDESVAIEKVKQSTGIMSEAMRSSRNAGNLIGRRTERSIRREGYSGLKVLSDAKEVVEKEGADNITNKFEDVELDTYKEVVSHSEHNISKTSDKDLSEDDARTLRNPKVQREIRRLSKARRKHMEENSQNKDYTAKSTDKEQMEKVAEMIDKKRKINKVKGYIRSPFHERKVQRDSKSRENSKQVTSNAKNIRDSIIEKQQAEIHEDLHDENVEVRETKLPDVENLDEIKKKAEEEFEKKADEEVSKVEKESDSNDKE